MKPIITSIFFVLFTSTFFIGVLSADTKSTKAKQNKQGETLYQTHCAHCHDGGHPRAPAKGIFLLGMTKSKVYHAITDGIMKKMAADLSERERNVLAEYLTFSQSTGSSKVQQQTPPKRCSGGASGVDYSRPDYNWFDYSKPIKASSWGISNTNNARLIPASVAKLDSNQVKKLKLKWAFAFPNATNARSQPAIAGGALFVGSHTGIVYALDANSGCVHWEFNAAAEIRAAISISPWQGNQPRAANKAPLVYIADRSGYTYAVNSVTGKLVWKIKVDSHQQAIITGSPTLYKNSLFVPVSSVEETIGGFADYPCCSFRGSVVALNARTGEKLWQTYTIPTQASARKKNIKGVQLYGPSGAAVFTSPTIDEKRGWLYIGSDNNYSTPADNNSNAIFAIKLDSGAIAWKRQMTQGNIYNSACHSDKINCPRAYKAGNWGFAASPVLAKTSEGRDVLVAGQKAGLVWGLDPDSGSILWKARLTQEGKTVGPYLGIAVENHRVFATVSQKQPIDKPFPEISKLGMYAIDVGRGDVLWSAPVSSHCNKKPCLGYTSAPTVIPGVVFNGANDGYLRAFDSATGKLLWQTNTAREYTALNGDTAQGGSFEGAGPVIVDGMVYINSGYSQNYYSIPGNVLLAFSVDGQ
jgi:polyvinyl alcohol dehydrogenase (cytochrome)